MISMTEKEHHNVWMALVTRGARLVPGFRVVAKDESKLMRFLYVVSFMWIWNRKFFDSFTTTIGRTVYMPYRMINENRWDIVAHELVHAHDYKAGPKMFLFGYLWPQWLALPSLLTSVALALIFGPWALTGLIVSVAMLFPRPSWTRMFLEVRGYSMGLCINTWTIKGYDPASDIDHIIKLLSGWDYYKTIQGEEQELEARARLSEYYYRARDLALTAESDHAPYRLVYRILKDNGVTV